MELWCATLESVPILARPLADAEKAIVVDPVANSDDDDDDDDNDNDNDN
jgi:hypothetical protein